jgi:hypothetical protein
MPKPVNHEENHNETILGRPIVRRVHTGGLAQRQCPTCGHREPVHEPSIGLQTTPDPVTDVVPDAAAIKSAFRALALLMEMLDGRRPARQMRKIAAPRVIRYLRAIPLGPGGLPGGVRLLSFHPSQPHEGAVEVAASVAIRGRRRAVAASFELTGLENWVCDTLRIL